MPTDNENVVFFLFSSSLLFGIELRKRGIFFDLFIYKTLFHVECWMLNVEPWWPWFLHLRVQWSKWRFKPYSESTCKQKCIYPFNWITTLYANKYPLWAEKSKRFINSKRRKIPTNCNESFLFRSLRFALHYSLFTLSVGTIKWPNAKIKKLFNGATGTKLK